MSRFTANRPSCWGVYSDAASFLRTMLFVGMALLSGMTLADDFTDAVRSFKNRQYQQALSLFEQGAKKEDPRAEYALGLLYQNGVIVKKDTGLGIKLITRSANRGFARAQNYLGVLFYEGNGVDTNLKEAFD